jgi:hypothetical protein
MFALRNRSRATNRSFGDASGSSTMFFNCCRCAGRRKCAMSCIASSVSRVSAPASTVRNRPSRPMPSVVTRR